MTNAPLSFDADLADGLRKCENRLRVKPSLATCDETAQLDVHLANSIDGEAVGRGTVSRILQALGEFGFTEAHVATLFPATTDAMISAELAGLDDSEAAQHALAMANEHPALHDAFVVASLGLGLVDTAPHAAPSRWSHGTQLFGRWTIERELGRGATAEIAVAIDSVLSSENETVRVVVKRFDDGVESARAHALREVRALHALPERVALRPIALHAPRGQAAVLVTRFEESRAPRCANDIAATARALDRVHAAGVTHGDLKPEHIRIRGDHSAFFIDFGFAGQATQECVRDDFARLVAIARPFVPSVIAATSNAAIQRGCPRLASAALRAFAPAALRWATQRAALAAAMLGVTATAGYAYGRWFAGNPTPVMSAVSSLEKNGTPLLVSGGALSALAQSGRLISARVRSDGRIDQLAVRWPEFPPEHYKQSPYGKYAPLQFVQFKPDGEVVFELSESRTIPSPSDWKSQ